MSVPGWPRYGDLIIGVLAVLLVVGIAITLWLYGLMATLGVISSTALGILLGFLAAIRWVAVAEPRDEGRRRE